MGRLLRQWRARRRLSRLALAVEAGIAARHLSFVETGRAQPSRAMVLLLARVLDVPPRGLNDLLAAAGHAPAHRETGLDAHEMAQVRRAPDVILAQREPFPALVLDRHWNVLRSNEASRRLFALFLPPGPNGVPGRPNAMRLTYHPRGLRPAIVNREATAAALIQWLHRDLLRGDDEATRELLAHPRRPPPLAHARPGRARPARPGHRAGPAAPSPPLLHDADEPRHPLRPHAARAAGRVLLPRRRRHRGGGPPARQRRRGRPARPARAPSRPGPGRLNRSPPLAYAAGARRPGAVHPRGAPP